MFRCFKLFKESKYSPFCFKFIFTFICVQPSEIKLKIRIYIAIPYIDFSEVFVQDPEIKQNSEIE